MKILILSTYFPPKASIASLRAHSFAKRWARLGHEVTVVCTDRHPFEAASELDCSGINVIRIPLPRIHRLLAKRTATAPSDGARKIADRKGVSFFTKLMAWRESTGVLKDQRMPSHLDIWGFAAYKYVRDENWDLVVSTFSPYVTHLIALRLKRKGRADFWIADYRDLWTGSHMFRGLPLVGIFERRLERWVNQSADAITTVSEDLARQIEDEFGVSHVFVIENGFDLEDIRNLPQGSILPNDRTTLLYAGSIYPGFRDPSPLFAAIASIRNSEMRALLVKLQVIFVGSGSAYVKDLAEKFQVSEFVCCLGMQERAKSLQMQREAHALLFLESDRPDAKGVLTGKLFEYINAGRQIWAIGISPRSAAAQLIHESQTGIVFGHDVEALTSELLALLRSGQPREAVAVAAVVNKYGRAGLADKMLEIAKARR